MNVKICGLTNLPDAQAAAEAGADLLGFIFYEKSPRYVPPPGVRSIIATLIAHEPQTAVSFVGVFVNTPAALISQILDFCGLHLAQLHGEEGVAYFQALRGRAFKALRPRSSAQAQADAEVYAPLAATNGPDLLVDAFHPGLRGGTGERADWSVAASLARRHRLLLAGGLTPDNVAKAVRQVRPWGVDTASGVEIEPGRKDHARLRAFVEAAKTASPQRRPA